MIDNASDSLQTLEAILGYSFKDIALLEQALVHGSADKNCNERLEFLGDSVLGLVIAKTVYQNYPDLTEGAMSRMRSSLVKGKQLAIIAKSLKLSQFIRLGYGEKKSGGATKASTLADTLEAIVAAIFLDSDFNTTSAVVLKWYQPLWESVQQLIQKDAKSRLQEWLQAKKYTLPKYHLCGTYGHAHEATFEIECVVEGFDKTIKTIDSTRRGAEQQAAQQFIDWLIEQGEVIQ